MVNSKLALGVLPERYCNQVLISIEETVRSAGRKKTTGVSMHTPREAPAKGGHVEAIFKSFAVKAAEIVGSSAAFLLAVLMIAAWAALGPHFHWSDAHQLFINTSTTIVTFLIVFIIQNTQNRDTKALHLKIDELLRATRGARNSMIDLDRLSDAQLRTLESEFKKICDGDIATAATEELERRDAEK